MSKKIKMENGLSNIIKISSKINIWSFIPILSLWRNRSLIYTLALREFASRHRNMTIGVLWVVIQPVLMACLLSVLMSKGIFYDGGAYFLNVLIGWGIWQSLSRFLGDGSQCLEASAGLITKVYFNRYVIPMSKIIAIFLDMALLFVPILLILSIAELIWHVPNINVFGTNFIFLILGIIWSLVLGFGIICFFNVITIKFRDVSQILGLLSMVWMFSSPIWTSRIDMLPAKYRFIATYNPAYSILSFCRHGLLNTPLLNTYDIYIQLIITICVLLVGLFTFNLLERRVIDEV